MLSAPSGVGKTTVATKLLKKDRRLLRAVTCTTRLPREGEKEGRDYFFLTPAHFALMRKRNAFLEWASVHKHKYGTPRPWTLAQMRRGRDVLLVIDVQGGNQVKRLYPDAVRIFLMPPSLRELKRRLLGRGSESAADLKVRLGNVKREMKAGRHYEHQVVNDRLAKAVSDVHRIIKAHRTATPTMTAETQSHRERL